MNKKKMEEFRKMALENKSCIILVDDGQGFSQVVNGGVRDLALMLAISMKECPTLFSVVEWALDAYKNVINEPAN